LDSHTLTMEGDAPMNKTKRKRISQVQSQGCLTGNQGRTNRI
jgi:hypothetical protein